MFKFRTQTLDSYIFYQVVHKNEYKLPDDLTDKIIIDIGAHIGSFSIACIQRNAKQIYAFEAHPENYELAKENISKISNTAIVKNLAVLGESNKKIGYNELSFNTGQHKINENPEDKYIYSISLNDIVNEITTEFGRKVDILKLDCEGSEYPILFETLSLYSIQNIVGEYHEINDEYNGENLIKFLKHSGFLTYHKHIQKAGLFFAIRKESPFLIKKELFS